MTFYPLQAANPGPETPPKKFSKGPQLHAPATFALQGPNHLLETKRFGTAVKFEGIARFPIEYFINSEKWRGREDWFSSWVRAKSLAVSESSRYSTVMTRLSWFDHAGL